MKKWLIAVPVVAAAAAGAALLLTGKGKDKDTAPKAAKPAAKPVAGKSAGKKAAGFAFKNPKTGVYSFASGYKDAKTVEVSLNYDEDKHSFTVASEDFITDTGDSHVAIIYADDFAMQVEYAAY